MLDKLPTTDDAQLEAMLSTASKVADATLRSFARSHDLPESWNVVVSFRMQHEDDLFHIQRTGCNESIIYVNAIQYLSLVQNKDKEAKQKFKMAAVRAIKLATTLSTNGNALITGDLAYAITTTRKRIRRAVIATSYNVLDDRYFSVTGHITVQDRLGGRELSSKILPSVSIDDQVLALKRELSFVMLQDAETEELIDLIEMARKRNVEYKPESYTIALSNGGIATTISYQPNHIPIDI